MSKKVYSSVSIDVNSSGIESICTDPEVVSEESASAVSIPSPINVDAATQQKVLV